MIFKSGEIFAERYQLIKQLGAGSFGEVWLAKDLMADDKIAIKFYRGLDQNGINEFKGEFKLARSLRQTNLLNLSHFDVFDQCPYLVMDYCPKGSAAQLRGNVSETRIWEFLRDVSAGLAYLHSQNIIHQDIKLGNILIDEKDRFIITDFGISKKIESHMQTFRCVTMESSGTLAYMGPERFKAPPIVVKASDMWSLGMCVYELVTGQVLWEFGGSTQLGGAEIPSLGGNYSSQLSQFFQRCLSVDAWERPTAQRAYEEAKAKLNGEVYYSRSITSSVSPSVTPSISTSIQNSFNQNRGTSGQRVSHSYNNVGMKKHEPTWWEKYGNMLKWGGGAVLLFVLALGGFSLLLSGDDNPIPKEKYLPKVDPVVHEHVVDTIPVDTPIVKPFVMPPPKVSPPAYRPKPKSDSVSTSKPVVNKEDEYWKQCKREDNVFLYNKYLNIYSKGKYVKEAKKRIRELESAKMNQKVHY